MGITIKELSEISGYSSATISRVLSNKGNVKEETREAIEKLLLEYNYRTNAMELRSREQKKKTIMIIAGVLGNDCIVNQIPVIKAEMQKYGYISLIAFSDNSVEEEENMVKLAIQEGYAGILFLNVRGGERLAEFLKRQEIPVVFMNREIRHTSFDAVAEDVYTEGFLAAKYLLERGHRRIGFVQGDFYSYTLQERYRGYQDALKAGKISEGKNNLIAGSSSYAGGYEAGKALVEKGLDFTALVCSTDGMLLGLATALRDCGVKIPEDLSLVSCDDGFNAQYLSVTAAGGVNVKKIARIACEILLSRMEGKETAGGLIVLRSEVVERNSVICVE